MPQTHLYKIPVLLELFASVDLSLIIYPEDPGDHAELHAPVYQIDKIRPQCSFPHTLSLEQSR